MAKNRSKSIKKPSSAGAEMIARMREGTKSFEIITWPGTEDEQLAMVVLHDDVLQACYARADKHFKSLGMKLDPYNADDFHNEVNIQVLAAAMYTVVEKDGCPGPGVLLFTNAGDYRKVSRPGERDMLSDAFCELQDEVNPKVDEVMADEETFAAITDAVKKKDVAALSAFDSNTLALYLSGTSDPSSS